ncbi:MAG: transcriptional regulator NrdR [Gammaproteobacteria bacterium]|jgi:transcriptional repressor NrdR|nr:transcriptional regulator NrdR [Gammaproteobacteria bacterium]|tara:strand:+ start:5162 stop:5614 length:453 start_codon:yes stop_codon:yes gene_type:complete
MFCPFCTKEETKVVDSRLVTNGSQIKRRRECIDCGERFSTYEAAELVMPRIIKSNERREPFDEEKLRAGLLTALEKRPVSADQIEDALHKVKDYIRKIGEREIEAQVIGKQVMNQLKELDQVAYVRFASVYQNFQDIKDFADEVSELSKD